MFCFSDSIAYGVYAAARELDIAIPGELSVIGYDDHPISTLLSPPLTSFSWGSKRLVEVAVQMLLAAMEGDPSVRRRVVIAPELRERGSTTPPGSLSSVGDPSTEPSRRRSGIPRVAGSGGPVRRGSAARIGNRPRTGKHSDEGHELGVLGGLVALSVDALSSVAYGPEAMMLVLVAGGATALRFTLPLTLVITGMLVLLVISYTQVIAAHPDGGGAYAVSKRNLGRWPALLAAASLVVDYVLTVAVSLAAGAASLASVFPGLSSHVLAVALISLAGLTAVNMFGIAESASCCCSR